MLWAFVGLVIGLLFGAIGTAVMGDSAVRPVLTAEGGGGDGALVPGPVPAPVLADAGCELSDDGAIRETPCRLDGATLSAVMDAGGPTDLLGSRRPAVTPLPLCDRREDGAITGAPCRILTSVPAPRPVTTAAAPADLPPPCTVNTDGSVTGARCVLSANVAAPAPVSLPAPEPEVLPRCEISMLDGTVTGAPCRLSANFRASRAGRTLNAEMAPRAPALADCRIDQATQAITNTPCQLQSAFRPVVDGSFGPVPKTALKVCPTRGFTTPEDLGCGLWVRDSGYVSLSKIAEAYYGDTDAACLIFDRNKDVFGTREAPVRRNDPHCILPEDILFMPATSLEADFGRCVTPPRRANVCEAG